MAMPRPMMLPSGRGSWLAPHSDRAGRVVLVVLSTIVGGAIWVHGSTTTPTSTPRSPCRDNASRTVAVLADLIDREVNQNRWVANDPPFLPAYLLDNMPAYQMGMMSAVGRFTTELRDRIARVRGSSAADPDLESAGGQPQLSRRQVDLRVVGHARAAQLGEPVSPGHGRPAPVQRATGPGPGGIRAPRRQPAGDARPHLGRSRRAPRPR